MAVNISVKNTLLLGGLSLYPYAKVCGLAQHPGTAASEVCLCDFSGQGVHTAEQPGNGHSQVGYGVSTRQGPGSWP